MHKVGSVIMVKLDFSVVDKSLVEEILEVGKAGYYDVLRLTDTYAIVNNDGVVATKEEVDTMIDFFNDRDREYPESLDLESGEYGLASGWLVTLDF